MERICSSGSKFFPLREVSILKRDVIVENHCLIQLSPFDVFNFFSIMTTPLSVTDNYELYSLVLLISRQSKFMAHAFSLSLNSYELFPHPFLHITFTSVVRMLK